MKWYADRLEALESAEPVYSVCGDDCAVCPRYLARTEEELRETAVFWAKAGWRDHVVSNEEIRCAGCGSRRTCSFMLLPCVREHQVRACRECPEYPCAKIADMLARSEQKKAQCRAACESDAEFRMLCRSFYNKEGNMRDQPCCDNGFDNHDSRITYYSLKMERPLDEVPDLPLPPGYRFVYYAPGDEASWTAIEISAKEIDDAEAGKAVWQRYFGGHEDEMAGRMFFVENARGEKVATATAYYDVFSGDDGVNGWVHWVAVRRDEQGHGLSKPLVARVLRQLKEIGYARAVLSTQTTSWLACKVYLDMGFRPIPENAETNRTGWSIVRRLTRHPALADFPEATLEETVGGYRPGDGMKTLGEILSDPRIRQIAPMAIRFMDLSKEPHWNKSLQTLKEEHFGGGLARGFDRLFAAAGSGGWYYPLYTPEECAEDPNREGVNLVWFPSKVPGAGERPYVLLVPGGGFVNVWNLTEGWPVAAQFNDLGYNVFILTYQVAVPDRVFEREMADFARAIRLIRNREKEFKVRWDRYVTCGFSAGGYLVCLWNVPEKGWAFHGLPGPRAVFPVYPVVSWKQCVREDDFDPESAQEFFGCDLETALASPFEIPEHCRDFPPCAIFVAAGDTLAEHSRLLAKALEQNNIPCRLEIGPEGGHGFADGSGMCMAGWTGRAMAWFETLTAGGQHGTV